MPLDIFRFILNKTFSNSSLSSCKIENKPQESHSRSLLLLNRLSFLDYCHCRHSDFIVHADFIVLTLTSLTEGSLVIVLFSVITPCFVFHTIKRAIKMLHGLWENSLLLYYTGILYCVLEGCFPKYVWKRIEM